MFDHTVKQLAAAFGEHPQSVRRRVESGEFKYGVHYIDLRPPHSNYAKYRFNLAACKSLFLVPPEKRS
jgi:hypothetical protein